MSKFFCCKKMNHNCLYYSEKTHVREESGSYVICENAHDKSDCRILYSGYWPYFFHANRYPLRLQVDYKILYSEVQRWTWMSSSIRWHAQSVSKLASSQSF